MSNELDLNFRPKTYFGPERLEKYLLSKVKGAVLRKKLKILFEEERYEDIRGLLGELALTSGQKALGSAHPMFMGGNYLPDSEDGEVEIGRISIKSVTYDVACVYAKPVKGRIRYRVVDEYEGETLEGPGEADTYQPMTLVEFADFFTSAWHLIKTLTVNFEEDLDRAFDFFWAESSFYPELDTLLRQRVIEYFRRPDGDGVGYGPTPAHDVLVSERDVKVGPNHGEDNHDQR